MWVTGLESIHYRKQYSLPSDKFTLRPWNIAHFLVETNQFPTPLSIAGSSCEFYWCPLEDVGITMEKSPLAYGEINEISMAIFNSFLYVYQRVNLHFPMVFLWFSYGFPMKKHTWKHQWPTVQWSFPPSNASVRGARSLESRIAAIISSGVPLMPFTARMRSWTDTAWRMIFLPDVWWKSSRDDDLNLYTIESIWYTDGWLKDYNYHSMKMDSIAETL